MFETIQKHLWGSMRHVYVQKLQMGPGDALVLTTERILSDAEKENLKKLFEGLGRVIVVDAGVKLSVVSKDNKKD